MGTNSFRTHKIISYSLKTALLFLAFICIFSLLAVPFSARQVQATDGDNESMAAAFVPPFSLPAGLVFNAPDRPLLYSHNADALWKSCCLRLMTLLSAQSDLLRMILYLYRKKLKSWQHWKRTPLSYLKEA